MNQEPLKVHLHLEYELMSKIIKHINKKPNLECGGYLIGKLERNDNGQDIVGHIEDIFHDDSMGSAGHFVFKSQYGLKAYSHCLKKYADKDGEFSKNIIGNYHSHGIHSAFFSDTDAGMMRASKSQEFYLVFSPAQHTFAAIYKDSDAKLYEVSCKYCYPKLKYIFPKMEFSKKWPLIKTGVDYPLLLSASMSVSCSKNVGMSNELSDGVFLSSVSEPTKTSDEISTLPNKQLVDGCLKEENNHEIAKLIQTSGQNSNKMSGEMMNGKIFFSEKNYDEAKQIFKKISGDKSKNPEEVSEAFYYLSKIIYSKNDKKEENAAASIKYINKAIEICPKEAKYYYERGLFYFKGLAGKKKYTNEAKSDFSSALKYQKNDECIDANYYIGVILYDEEYYENAIKCFEKCKMSSDRDIANNAIKKINNAETKIGKHRWKK